MTYQGRYVAFLKQCAALDKDLKIVVDCSNGSTAPLVKKLFGVLPHVRARFLHVNVDGHFPGHGPNPLKAGALRDLQKAVRQSQADCGIIFDADGDRVFFVDEEGIFIDPDVIARLLIWYLRPKKVVAGARTGWHVKRLQIANCKLQIFESRVGHYYMKKKMRSMKADFGTERSGHYYYKQFFFADAGVLTAVHVLNALSRLPYTLSQFIALSPQYFHSGELNFKGHEGILERVLSRYRNGARRVSRLDGVSLEFDDWWFSLRFSNTESLLRLNVEATSSPLLRAKIREFRHLLTA